MTTNEESNRQTTVWLNSHDEQEDIYINNLTYPVNVEIKSEELQKVLNQIVKLGGVQVLQITYAKNMLIFSAKGETAKFETKIDHVENRDEYNEIININVNVKMVAHFVKCAPLSPFARLYLNNEAPLMIEYNVGQLGVVRLGITQRRIDDDL